MATCGEIVADVQLIVPVPERESLIRKKVNGAIRFISSSGYFWRDIVESTIGAVEGVDATALTQSITITTEVRKLIYVQYPTYTEEEDKITCLELDAIKKRELCQALNNVAYLSGTKLHIRHTKLSSAFNLGYYTNPAPFATDGSEDALSNWITDLASDLVVDLTSSYILNLIGNNEDSKRIGDLTGAMRGVYVQDFMRSVGA
jgi:hypothetical protein